MVSPTGLTPGEWLQRYCPVLDGQFVFLNPLSWETHLLTESAVLVLREAAVSIEENRFDAFLDEVAEAGGWPPGLEFLARSLTTLVDQKREAGQ
ncbi:hypothetical protein [Aromatoleum buckelii]|uniref:Uncharacterized protein n=1 Tax=Aromatoleum buckelii TaxID=200254 RepID=A0ABX1MXI4_9RHOO|nr:hypothetical protein [Aromatoleum buckelii]MCK0512094.1 hypothetical protein [Aromatoleum buckelii]